MAAFLEKTAEIEVNAPPEKVHDAIRLQYIPNAGCHSVKADDTRFLITAALGKTEGLSTWEFRCQPVGTGNTLLALTLAMPNAPMTVGIFLRKKLQRSADECVTGIKTLVERA